MRYAGAMTMKREPMSHRYRSIALLLLSLCLGCDGCAPSTEVIEMRSAPQATKDAMLQVKVLPLGMAAPAGVGSISPVLGYACATNSETAGSKAVEQLQAKALQLHADAVVDVMIGPADEGICLGQGMIARGMAVGSRAFPSAY
jgi:hypothetical protein